MLVDTVANYNRDFKDTWNTAPHAPWFEALVWMEFALQLPIGLYLVLCFARQSNSIRVPAIIWGTNIATCTFACMYEVFHSADHTDEEKLKLLGIYSSWFFVPLLTAVYFSIYSEPFGKPALDNKKRQ